MNYFKLIVLGVICIMLVGCVDVKQVEDMPLYSRQETLFMCDSESFGSFSTDDIYVALDYIYNDKKISDNHGKTFEVTSDDVICVNSETMHEGGLSNFSGNAEYMIRIEDVVYDVVLKKDVDGIWEVVKCEITDEEVLFADDIENKNLFEENFINC